MATPSKCVNFPAVLFNISIQRADQAGSLNLNVQVEAPDAVSALEAAKAQLRKTLEASGLSVAPAVPPATTPPVTP